MSETNELIRIILCSDSEIYKVLFPQNNIQNSQEIGVEYVRKKFDGNDVIFWIFPKSNLKEIRFPLENFADGAVFVYDKNEEKQGNYYWSFQEENKKTILLLEKVENPSDESKDIKLSQYLKFRNCESLEDDVFYKNLEGSSEQEKVIKYIIEEKKKEQNQTSEFEKVNNDGESKCKVL